MPLSSKAGDVALYIDPTTHHFLGDRLFEDDADRLNGDGQNAPYMHVRAALSELGIPVRTADYLPSAADATRKIYVSMGNTERWKTLRHRPDVTLSAFFALECPIVEPRLYRALPRLAHHFRRMFSWSGSDALRRFTGADLPLQLFRWPQSFDEVHETIWRERSRKFLVMINANKLPRVYWHELYTERMRAVAYFNRTGEIDLYGKGWDGPSMRVGQTWVPGTVKKMWLHVQRRTDRVRTTPLLGAARRAYRGAAASKRLVLGQYTFALCFENCVLEGWITEKLFDCFFAGTVPIYWGAPEIADIVPAGCFIDMRQFGDYGELRQYLHSLSAADIDGYRQQARAFLNADGYRQFTRAAFTERLRHVVLEDAGLQAAPGGG